MVEYRSIGKTHERIQKRLVQKEGLVQVSHLNLPGLYGSIPNFLQLVRDPVFFWSAGTVSLL